MESESTDPNLMLLSLNLSDSEPEEGVAPGNTATTTTGPTTEYQPTRAERTALSEDCFPGLETDLPTQDRERQYQHHDPPPPPTNPAPQTTSPSPAARGRGTVFPAAVMPRRRLFVRAAFWKDEAEVEA
ncbi:predicted protein [Chaetomium globosum CBS 148.51]|uniref:Uncharacterized protein n=1 Tax=Chaetomium globosum (strain ATCC 6205 / CBS 148.51 / DSM 1962 / NBRC 6347 / NRRL 1970) TaxID=306901 RepID=Q2GYA6_CHAGB|nr:uncharacterized protein CHGG_07048 [Chaetomium globosum CBS 148.51]EAQ85795.1 predicted protein [Chaetomium globosum CBS 148.51]